jgi:hypothetical protein
LRFGQEGSFAEFAQAFGLESAASATLAGEGARGHPFQFFNHERGPLGMKIEKAQLYAAPFSYSIVIE